MDSTTHGQRSNSVRRMKKDSETVMGRVTPGRVLRPLRDRARGRVFVCVILQARGRSGKGSRAVGSFTILFDTFIKNVKMNKFYIQF
jgi:hypothetical protein